MTAILTVTVNPAIDVATIAESVVHTHKLRCTAVSRDPGGGGINVARVVTRFGGACRALYPTGGPLGELLRRLISEEGVESICTGINDDTRESFTVCDATSGKEYRFVLPGPELSEDEWRAILKQVNELQPSPSYVVASGSLPPGVPPAFYSELGDVSRSLGARFIVDTSGKALAAALDKGVHLVKPNLRELAELVGRELDSEPQWAEAAQELVNAGRAEAVALSLGHRGALLATSSGIWRAAPLDIKPSSAVGAGDSFLGGMVWALDQGSDMPDAFRWGVASGSAALLSSGTGLCRWEDVEALYPQVTLSEL